MDLSVDRVGDMGIGRMRPLDSSAIVPNEVQRGVQLRVEYGFDGDVHWKVKSGAEREIEWCHHHDVEGTVLRSVNSAMVHRPQYSVMRDRSV